MSNTVTLALDGQAPMMGGRGLRLLPNTYVLFVGPMGCCRHCGGNYYQEGSSSMVCPTDVQVSLGLIDECIKDAFAEVVADHDVDVLVAIGTCPMPFSGFDETLLASDIIAEYGVRFAYAGYNRLRDDIPGAAGGPGGPGAGGPGGRPRPGGGPGMLDEKKIYIDLIKQGSDPAKPERPIVLYLAAPSASAGPRGNTLQALCDALGFELMAYGTWENLADLDRMRAAKLAVVADDGYLGFAQQLKREFGVPYVEAPLSYQFWDAKAAVDGVIEALELDDEQLELANQVADAERVACIQAISKTRDALDGAPVIIDGNSTSQPFGVARTLIEQDIYIAQIKDVSRRFFGRDISSSDLEWLDENAPGLVPFEEEGDGFPPRPPRGRRPGRPGEPQPDPRTQLLEGSYWGYGALTHLADALTDAAIAAAQQPTNIYWEEF